MVKVISGEKLPKLDNAEFPDSLKRADVTSVHKKGDTSLMNNYRPISVLPTLSKLFEKLLYQQINSYINTYLNSGLCGLRVGFSFHYFLITMTEKIKNVHDKGEICGALLTDLSNC